MTSDLEREMNEDTVRTPSRLLAIAAVGALTLAACGSDDATSPGQVEPTDDGTVTTSPTPLDPGDDDTTRSDGGVASPTASPDRGHGDVARGDSAPFCTLEPELDQVEHVEFAYPQGWQVEDGNCRFFDAELSELPEDTEPPAAISVRITDTPFSRTAEPNEATREDARHVGARSGYQAVRVLGESTGDGLRPKGEPVLTYLVDLDEGTDEQGGTLVLSARPTDGTTFEQAREALDRMARTVRLVPAVSQADPMVVTRIEGGGSPFTVTLSDGCFQLRSGGPDADVADEACDIQPSDSLSAGLLGDGIAVGYAPALAVLVESDAASAPFGAFTTSLEGASAFAYRVGEQPTELRAVGLDGDVLERTTVGR